MNKPKVNEEWVGKRLTLSNVTSYLKDIGFNWNKISENYTIQEINPFLQKNFGGDGDCTLVSILTIVKYYKPELDANEIYDGIEKIAKKYLYTQKWGTFSIFNSSIIKEVFSLFKINRRPISKHFKGFGFNENTIINELKQNHPVIISIQKDGRNYYNQHTITIIGYMVFEDAENKKRFLFKVYDNWYNKITFLDYTILGIDCVICY